MAETNILSEDIAAAEEIAAYRDLHPSLHVEKYVAIIAAHRPPLVARLVSDLARKTAALQALKLRMIFVGWPAEPMWAPHGISIPDWRKEFAILEAALSPAPALDLAKIERALKRAQKALRNSREANHPTAVTVEMMALGEIDAALASVQEVTR